MVTQLRGDGTGEFVAIDQRSIRDRCDPPTLTQLVVAAADVASDRPAMVGSDYTVTFADLHGRARRVAVAMSGSARVDDSALTIALMTTVPQLAESGPGALAETLAAIRMRATMAVAVA